MPRVFASAIFLALLLVAPAQHAAAEQAPAGWHSAWVTQSEYPTMDSGEVREFWIRFRNTGSETWIRGIWGNQVNLALNGDNKEPFRLGMASDWLWDDRLATTTAPLVRSGETAEFRFKIRAPGAEGTYELNLRPVVDGLQWLEDEGVFWKIVVTGPAKFDFDDAVATSLREQTRSAITSARRFFGYSGPLTVFVSESPEWIIGKYVAFNRIVSGPGLDQLRSRWRTWGCMEAEPGAIFFKTSCMTGAGNEFLSMKLAHEYFHTIQGYLTKKKPGGTDSEVPQDGPRWLTEGSAVYAEIRFAESNNPAYGAERVAETRARLSAPSRPLRCLETMNGMNSLSSDQSYALGYAASDYLASLSGRSSVLVSFWLNQIPALSWQAAFAQTFGMSVDGFYSRFEDYRRKAFPGPVAAECFPS